MAAKKSMVKKKDAVVSVNVDAGLKKLYGDALSRLEQANLEGAKAWDIRYEAIADMVEHQPPLYLAGGFSTEADFFKRYVGEARNVVYRNIRVAKYATATEIETFTASRLDEAITWLETKNGGPLPGRTPVDFSKLRFPFKKDGKTVSKTLADITVQELRAAIALLKGKQATSKSASPEARAVADLVKKSGAKGTTFAIHGKTLVLRVPLESVARVGAALSKFSVPQK